MICKPMRNLKNFYKFIKTEFDNGESIFEILEKVANKKVDKTV